MYVYWWHVGGLRAVKVGHADDPRQRVSDYRSDFRLGGKDVRGYKLDRGTDAAWVESQLCRLLETKGLRRIALRLGDEEEEFFALGGRTFEDADEILSDATRHIALAEFSNQRKRQMRQELQGAQVSTPPQQEQTPPSRNRRSPRRTRRRIRHTKSCARTNNTPLQLLLSPPRRDAGFIWSEQSWCAAW